MELDLQSLFEFIWDGPTIPPISVVQKIRPYAEVVDLPINHF